MMQRCPRFQAGANVFFSLISSPFALKVENFFSFMGFVHQKGTNSQSIDTSSRPPSIERTTGRD
jgi:hypothetical protein